mmetsp:Transcript_45168/g.51894  ORF Transcript_45168/g.51894 Transcript_45168/m.51894 type:complete len:284 (+) Transcript_45168:1174-2025(+)
MKSSTTKLKKPPSGSTRSLTLRDQPLEKRSLQLQGPTNLQVKKVAPKRCSRVAELGSTKTEMMKTTRSKETSMVNLATTVPAIASKTARAVNRVITPLKKIKKLVILTMKKENRKLLLKILPQHPAIRTEEAAEEVVMDVVNIERTVDEMTETTMAMRTTDNLTVVTNEKTHTEDAAEVEEVVEIAEVIADATSPKHLLMVIQTLAVASIVDLVIISILELRNVNAARYWVLANKEKSRNLKRLPENKISSTGSCELLPNQQFSLRCQPYQVFGATFLSLETS